MSIWDRTPVKPGGPLRVLWHSNGPNLGSGYGKQSGLAIPALKSLGCEVAIASTVGQHVAMSEWNGFPVYPASRTDMNGYDSLAAYAKHWQADIVISLYDIWMAKPQHVKNIRWCPLFPIDAAPMSKMVADKSKLAYQPMVYSQFGLEQARAIGLEPLYVPHMVDTETYQPLDQNACRDLVGLPRDAFIFGIVAANTDEIGRKAFYEQIEAFSIFAKKHDDAILYLHTAMDGRLQRGVDLWAVIDYFGIADKVRHSDQNLMGLGLISDVDLAIIYNTFDCFLSVSMGEGFGVPILEAQACGKPVITGDWSAMSEISFVGCQVRKEDANREFNQLLSYWYKPKPLAIYYELELMYDYLATNGYRKGFGERARNGALEYSIENVTERYWKPALEAIKTKIANEPKPVAARSFFQQLEVV